MASSVKWAERLAGNGARMVYCKTNEPTPRGRKEGENTKMKMKKLLAIIAVLMAMVLVLSACGQKEESSSGSSSSNSSSSSSSNSASAPAAPTIEGSWKLTDLKMAGASAEEQAMSSQSIANGSMSMEMTLRDGKMTSVQSIDYSKMGMTGEGVPAPETLTTTGTYTVDGNKLLIIPDDADAGSTAPTEFKLNGNTLEIIDAEVTMIFTRK